MAAAFCPLAGPALPPPQAVLAPLPKTHPLPLCCPLSATAALTAVAAVKLLGCVEEDSKVEAVFHEVGVADVVLGHPCARQRGGGGGAWVIQLGRRGPGRRAAEGGVSSKSCHHSYMPRLLKKTKDKKPTSSQQDGACLARRRLHGVVVHGADVLHKRVGMWQQQGQQWVQAKLQQLEAPSSSSDSTGDAGGSSRCPAMQPSHSPAQCPAPAPGSCSCGRTACRPGSRLWARNSSNIRPALSLRNQGQADCWLAGPSAATKQGTTHPPTRATQATHPPSHPPRHPPTCEGWAEDRDVVLPGPVVDRVRVVDLLAQPRNHLQAGGRAGRQAGGRAGGRADSRQ